MCRVLTKTSHLPGISLLLSYLISFHVTLLPNKRNHDSSLVPEIFTHCRDNIAAASTFIGGFCPYGRRRVRGGMSFEEALTYEDCLALRHARPPPTSDDNPLATLTDILCHDLIYIKRRYGKGGGRKK